MWDSQFNLHLWLDSTTSQEMHRPPTMPATISQAMLAMLVHMDKSSLLGVTRVILPTKETKPTEPDTLSTHQLHTGIYPLNPSRQPGTLSPILGMILIDQSHWPQKQSQVGRDQGSRDQDRRNHMEEAIQESRILSYQINTIQRDMIKCSRASLNDLMGLILRSSSCQVHMHQGKAGWW